MPTYQYHCTECDQELEAFQKFTDPALTVCPECGGRLRKVFNSVGVVFKGSGFYSTDNKSHAAITAKPAESSDSASSSSADSTNSSSSAASTDSTASASASSKPVEKSAANTAANAN